MAGNGSAAGGTRPVSPVSSAAHDYRERLREVARQVDRQFVWLFAAQWACGILLAATVSPLAWAGSGPAGPRAYLLLAGVLGAALVLPPVWLALRRPGETLTRHVVAVAQMLFSALLIYLSGGRVETHFHVFGSLAFLTFYRDQRVLLTASAVVLCHQFGAALFWPAAAFGPAATAVGGEAPLAAALVRAAEHLLWVVFEDLFLLVSIRRARAETREVARSVDHARQLAEAMPQIVWTTDPAGRHDYCNRRFYEYAGLPVPPPGAGLADEVWHATVHPEDLPPVLAAWRHALRSGEPHHRAYRLRGRDGTYRWHLCRALPVREPDGRILRWVGTNTDVHEQTELLAEHARLQAELEAKVRARTAELARTNAALTAEREFLDAVLQNVQVMVIACDAAGRLTHFNHAARDEHGRPPNEAVPPERWAEHFGMCGPDGRTPLSKEQIPLWRALQGQHVRDEEFTVWLRPPPAPGPAPDGAPTGPDPGPDPGPAVPRTGIANAAPIVDRHGRRLGAMVSIHDVTARQAVEAARQDSEARFRTFMDNMPTLAWIKDADGRFVYANRLLQSVFGREEAQIIGATDAAFSQDPEVLRKLRANDQEVLESGRTAEYMEVVPNPDGSATHWLSAKFLVVGEGGRRLVGGVAQNLTARVRAEEALREATARAERENQFSESLVNLAPNIIYVFDLARMSNVYVNRDLADFLGYSSAEMRAMGANFLAATAHPDDLPFLYRRLEEFERLAVNGAVEFTARFRSATGQWRWFLHREAVFRRRREDGAPLQLIGVAQDVTLIKQAEHELRQSQTDLKETQRLARLGTWQFDPYQEKITWSEEAFQIAGLEPGPDTPAFPDYLATVHPEDRPRLLERLTALVERHEPYSLELRHRLPDGSFNHVRSQAKPILEDGHLVRVLGSVLDITTLKRTEQALIRAREEALAAARVKAEFLANMSHEIRTPLNGIIGMSDLLAETGLDEVQRDYVRTVQDCGTSLLGVINDILDFSKIDADRLELEEVDYDPVGLVEGQVGLLTAQALAKNVSLLTFVDPALPALLRGDPGRTGQVLLNLVNNALKFTPQGGTVVVRAQAVPGPDPADPAGGNPRPRARLRCAVQDTGIGLSETARARLFRPFTQADGSTTRKYGGTGLGLSICKRLVEMMGGQIGVESVPGEGATFWFELPLNAPPPREAAGPAVGDPPPPPPLADPADPANLADPAAGTDGPGSAGASAAAREGPPAPARVLVVDDCPAAAQIFCAYLQGWGLAPRAVGTGAAALAELRDRAREGTPYALALIDKRLPEPLDGFALARLIQEDAGLRATPLVLVSAFDGLTPRPGALEAGFAAYLPKPVRQADLRRTVSAFLDAPGSVRGGLPTGASGPSAVPTPAPVTAPGSDAGRLVPPPPGPGVVGEQPAGRPARKKRRVLVVEDNAVNQKLILTQLQGLGYSAQAVGDGQEALVALEKTDFELVLMDCQMPRMDGLEATARIRRRERDAREQHDAGDAGGGPGGSGLPGPLPAAGEPGGEGRRRGGRVPIVALTANALAEDRERCLAAGMDDYLTKPVRKEKLAEVLQRWLEAGSLPAGPAGSPPRAGE